MKYILKCLHKSINSVTPIHVFLCLYSFTRRKRFYMYQARFIYRITSINLLYYCLNLPRIYWTIILMRCNAVLGNINLSRLWGGNTLLWFFLTSLNTLITRCTRSKARCTLLNIAAHSKHCCTLSNLTAHSPKSLYTLAYTPKPRCTFSNLPVHSPTSIAAHYPTLLHTLERRCTLSKLAIHYCIHSRTSLYTLKPPSTLPNLASYSQTSLHTLTLNPSCTLSV